LLPAARNVGDKAPRKDGRPLPLAETTLRRWIKAYDDDLAGLRPKARVDKGWREIIIADAAERAILFDFETWQRIAAELRKYIRGRWKANVTLKLIRGRANIKYRELITAAGFGHCHTLPDSTFNVPHAFIEAERCNSNVAIFRKDRKTDDDRQRFRIPRSRAGMLTALFASRSFSVGLKTWRASDNAWPRRASIGTSSTTTTPSRPGIDDAYGLFDGRGFPISAEIAGIAVVPSRGGLPRTAGLSSPPRRIGSPSKDVQAGLEVAY
jgi:hypothetical protein